MADKPVKFQVEELDPWPDPDGFVRYRVLNNVRNSVVSVNKWCWERPFIMTEVDAWHYLEQQLYPEFPGAFCEDTVFSADEVEKIRQQIGRYIMVIKS